MSPDTDVLTSKRVEITGTADDAIEYCYQQGWSDGLPVVPPTEDKVLRLLDFAGRHPSDVIGVEPVRGRVITAEKVAINAVMAGCLPEYMPVVVAAVESMVQPEYNLHGTSGSTMGAAPLLVINGPVSPNPPKDTDGRREESGRGWVRELQGRWPGVLG